MAPSRWRRRAAATHWSLRRRVLPSPRRRRWQGLKLLQGSVVHRSRQTDGQQECKDKQWSSLHHAACIDCCAAVLRAAA